jgi:hypothetical protein
MLITVSRGIKRNTTWDIVYNLLDIVYNINYELIPNPASGFPLLTKERD